MNYAFSLVFRHFPVFQQSIAQQQLAGKNLGANKTELNFHVPLRIICDAHESVNEIFTVLLGGSVIGCHNTRRRQHSPL